MRLIDADALKYELFADNYSEKITAQEVADCIDLQSTAYDVDKVVKELERLSDSYDGNIGKRKAIEIVKQGGSTEIEKTCKNCKYEKEPVGSVHCIDCMHRLDFTDNFEPKETDLSKVVNEMVQDIRNKAIDDFAEVVKVAVTEMDDISAYDNPTKRICEILQIEAERLKAGE